ncbi:MAG: hypothetical protein H7315_01975 [Herminiimonas sp.]|nr:hypothetical protein [Herminiimonas sp.]
MGEHVPQVRFEGLQFAVTLRQQCLARSACPSKRTVASAICLSMTPWRTMPTSANGALTRFVSQACCVSDCLNWDEKFGCRFLRSSETKESNVAPAVYLTGTTVASSVTFVQTVQMRC